MSADAGPRPDAGAVVGFDHVPMRDTDAMVAFYRSLGLSVTENLSAVQVHVGDQMINFHRPELWSRDFPLRATSAVPPCGDLCLVWRGSADALHRALDCAGAVIVEGSVERVGGRRRSASSVYVRDPDGNLLEFINYQDEWEEHVRVS